MPNPEVLFQAVRPEDADSQRIRERRTVMCSGCHAEAIAQPAS